MSGAAIAAGFVTHMTRRLARRSVRVWRKRGRRILRPVAPVGLALAIVWSTIAPALPPPAGRVAQAQGTATVAIETIQANFYANTALGAAVTFTSSSSVVHTQEFPRGFAFNPPAAMVFACSNLDMSETAGAYNEHRRPWTFIERFANGTCQPHAAGNGSSYQPGVDGRPEENFQAGMLSTLHVSGSGSISVEFEVWADDGWLLGLGPKDGAAGGSQPTRNTGASSTDGYGYSGMPATTVRSQRTVVGANNHSPGGLPRQYFTVTFPEPGAYPIEVDYANCCNEDYPAGALVFVLKANGQYLEQWVPPTPTPTATSTGTATNTATATNTSTPTATPTPAPPIESPPTDTIYNPPFINAGTSAGGAHTFTGRFHTAEVDVAIAGRGPSPVVARTYNGGDPRVGALGPNWIHSYEMRIARAEGSDDVFLTGPMGRVDRYTPSGGALAPPEGVLGTVDSRASSRRTAESDMAARVFALFGDGGPLGFVTSFIRFFAPGRALAAPSAQTSTITYTPPPGVHTKLTRNADYTFTATHKDQTTWTFDGTGRLERIDDRYGNRSTVSYDGNSRISTVSDPAGRGSLAFTHDPASGRLTKVTDWLGPTPREVQYQYDAQGRLWKVTDREGAVTEYGYDGASSRLTTIKDPLGNVQVTNTYDAAGRVQTQKDARGLSTGQQTTNAYTVNADGTRRTDITYPQTSFEPTWSSAARDDYDARGWLTRRELEPTATETLVEHAAYDAIGNLVSVSDPRSGTTTFCYDTALDGATLLNTRGNLTRRIDPQDVNGMRPTTLFCYSTDQKDNLELVVPPNGVPSSANTSCSENFSGAATSPQRTELTYDAAGAKLTAATQRFTDPDTGLQTATTKYEYNDTANPGRITRAIPPRGNTSGTPDASYATTFTWFGSGARAGMLDRVTDPLEQVTTFDCDAVGRRTSAVGPLGNVSAGTPANFRSTTSYDREDRPRVTSAPAPTAGGAAITAENRYDAAGNRTVAIDPLGQVTKYLYDERNQLAEVRQSPSVWTDPNVEPSDRISTKYEYDHLAALKRVIRAQGDSTNERVTDYENDGLGRTRRELQYPGWPSTSGALINAATYDGNGNRDSLTQPDGLTTGFTHDALNRLTAVTYSDGQTPSVSYAYDKNSNRTRMDDGQGATTYVYDERDAMTSTTSPLPGCGPGSVVGYRYDLDGNRTKVIYPPSSGCGASADAVTYFFDKASRLESLVGWGGRKTAYDYFPDGALKGTTFSIGEVDKTRSDYSYDNARRLTQVDNRFVGNGINTVDAITSHAYGMDAAGNRTAAQERTARVGSFAPNPAAAPDPLMKEPPGSVSAPATSLALDSAGRPVVAYVDQTTGQLRLLRCGGATCGPAGAGDPLNQQLLADELSSASFPIALALDVQDRPIVAFSGLSDTGESAVVVIRCGNADCSGGNSREVIEQGSTNGYDHVSMVLDGAGRPALSYQNRQTWQLKVARCGDAQCSPASTTVSAPIPTADGHSGYHSTIAIGPDNLPIVAHNDARALRVVRCGNAACSSVTSHALPETDWNEAFSGHHNSIRLDAAGSPVISYSRTGEFSNPSSVRLVHCTNAGCTGTQSPVMIDTNPGGWTSLRLDSRGLPVVSYYDAVSADLELFRCNDAACGTTAALKTSPDTTGSVGKGTSIELDSGGYPVISYFDETNGDLRVLRCNSASCGGAPNVLPTPTVAPTATPAAGTIAVPDCNGDVGRFTSIALDAQGNPVVSYLDVSNGDLKVLDCATPACGAGSVSLGVDPNAAATLDSTVKLDSLGRPVVAYMGSAGLTILRCGDAACASGNTITPTGIVAAWEPSLALDSEDRPVVAFNERDALDLALMRCDDATCTTHSLTRPDTSIDTGWSPSLTLDSADRPVVLFHQGFNFGAALLHCADATCSAGGSHTLRNLQINEPASFTALTLTADGGVAMAYRTASGLTYVRCDDLDCTAAPTPRVVDTGPATWISIDADSSSRATISYAVGDITGSFDLKVLRCGNTACAVGNTTVVADSAGSVGEYSSIALDAAGYPIVSYYDRTNGDLGPVTK